MTLGNQVTLRETPEELILGNGVLTCALDRESGFLVSLHNQQSGLRYKTPDKGSWPFEIAYESPEGKGTVEMRATSGQAMSYRFSSAFDGSGSLAMEYRDLIGKDKHESTGIRLLVRVLLQPSADYILVTAKMAISGSKSLTRLSSGPCALAHAQEEGTLTVPGVGQIPARALQVEWFDYPPGLDLAELQRVFPDPPHDQLAAGWLDYTAGNGGIGVGYINRDGMNMIFEARGSQANGASLNWELFNLTKGYWHNSIMVRRGEVTYPLKSGESFETGEWIIVPHAGSWHRTAQAYRERYLTHLSDARSRNSASLANKFDIVLDFLAGGLGGYNWLPEQDPGRILHNRFLDIPQQVRAIIGGLGVQPERTAVTIAGHTPHTYGFPDFFPCWEAAGGDKDAIEMCRILREEIGVRSIRFYAHLSWMHPEARHKVPEAVVADSMNAAQGNVACLDNSVWQALWRGVLVPQYSSIGANGLYVDEGGVINLICEKGEKEHLHGTSSLGILTGQTRGIWELSRILRQELGTDCLLVVEGACDLTGRNFDVCQYTDLPARFTHPNRVYQDLLKNPGDFHDVRRFVLLGLVPEIPPGMFPDPGLLRRALSVRRSLLDRKAPGYPGGFADDLGVTVSDPGVIAKVFADPALGLTVLYATDEARDVTIRVDGSRLGLPGIKEARQVHTKPKEVGVLVLPIKAE